MNKSNKFQLGNVTLISFAHLVHDTFSSFVAPLLPLLIEKLSLSYSLAGFLTVVQRLPSVFSPFIGMLADRVSMRYILIFAPSVTAVFMCLVGLVNSYILLLVCLLSAGIGIALFHVPAPVMIKKVSGNKTGRGMSLFMFGGEIARSVGPMVVLGAVAMWGLEGTYKLIPIGLGASAILFWRFRNLPISEAFKKKEESTGIKDTFIRYLPFFLNITGIVFFTSLLRSTLTIFLPTYITSAGESLWAGGISLSILQFAGAAGTLFSGTISDKLGRRKTLLTMMLVSPLLMWLFVSMDNSLAVPLLLLLGFFLFATNPILLAVVNDIDTEHAAFMNGIFMTINFLFSALAVIIVGALSDLIGLQMTYSIAPLFGLLAIPSILGLREK